MLLFGAWYFLRYEDYASPATALKVTLIKVIDLAILVYVTNYVLIPRLLYKKHYVWFALVLFVMIVGSSFYKMYVLGRVTNTPALINFTSNLKARIYDNVIPHFFLVIAGAAIKLVSDHIRMQKRLVEMAKDRAEAELNFLKSQINPHFLFNSLNAVYFLIAKENDKARNALHKFSDMLRYQLYECNGEKIPIEKEIAYLRDYVDLQKLRHESRDKVEFNCSPDVKGFLIEPLLLIPFVENSFKHLSHHSGKENLVRIDANRKNGKFSFSVQNTLEQNSDKGKIGGIGLKNVRRRLELLYPEKHSLDIHESDEMYIVNLKIEIDPEKN